MPTLTKEYQSHVLDDINSFEGLSHPVKTNLLLRLITRKMAIQKLHPNPDDEFCVSDIGPNYEIVSNYETAFRYNLKRDLPPVPENDPLVIEKMSTGGYMLLNGHHRWFAALRLPEIKKMPVRIVNVTPFEQIINTMDRSHNKMCASFDLDEVLFTDGSIYPSDRELRFPMNLIYKKKLKKNAGVLISELKNMGFDIWVYTGEHYSQEYINGFFKLHHTAVDGVINGLRKNKYQKRLKSAFTEKYDVSLHIDNTGIICHNTRTHDYDIVDFELESKGDWSAKVFEKVKDLEIVKANRKGNHEKE